MNNKKTILIVDDDDVTRETYAQLFRDNNFNVFEAADGIEGLDIATSEMGIDIIFSGIIMPRMDGFQLIEALRKRTATAAIPVVFNSHLGREEDRKTAMDLGAKDFIIRGVTTPSEVLKRINFQLNERSYMVKIDPFDLDAQDFIENSEINNEFKCDNCGTDLALKLIVGDGGNLQAGIVCPNCKKAY